MMRDQGMNIMRGTLLVASALLVFACGRNETTASKSAAAYREAQAKEAPVAAGHDHSGHGATAGEKAEMDHSAHGGGGGGGGGADPHAGHDMTASGTMDHSAHGAMDHSAHSAHGAMDHSAHSAHGAVAATDHSTHAPTPSTAAHDHHAGMQHEEASPAAAHAHAQHQQPPGAPAHAGHGAMQSAAAGPPSVVLHAPTSNAEMARTRPAATLQPDDFDAPAPIAVEEARKAADGGRGHEGHGQHKKEH
ncbi:MAG TPA: hypothetical protein VF432_26190 [Thermoanaerobaculia bacterium]